MKEIRIAATVGIALVGLIAVGCSNSSSTKTTVPVSSPRRSTTTATRQTAQATTPSSTTSIGSATTAGSVTCQPTHLAASLSARGGAAGHGEQTVSLTNTGTTSCTLYGFPGLGLLNQADQSVPLVVTRATTAGMAFPAILETTVTLTPGGEPAAFGMEWINGPSSATYSLQVTPPNDTGYLVIPDQTDVFANNQVSVTPVAPVGQLK
jgi:hypothetical protein